MKKDFLQTDVTYDFIISYMYVNPKWFLNISGLLLDHVFSSNVFKTKEYRGG